MNLARVFPRRTEQSPDDDHAFFGMPDIKTTPFFDAVDISVAYTYDIEKAERLAERWRHHTSSVRIGGPAFGNPSGEFIPGKYVKKGVTFTSRGCTNKCWFCSVWKREPKMLELEIKPGYIIQDDNFLACSEKHIRSVFEMLKTQEQRVKFSGGLEAKILKDWHAQLMKKAKMADACFAYDTKDDLEPLRVAGELMANYGYTFGSKKLRCFVLCGFKGDTLDAAAKRMKETVVAGFWPLAMLWRDAKGDRDPVWMDFSRYWARPALYFREANRIRAEHMLGDLI